MKLILAIVSDDDGQRVMAALNKEGFIVTNIATTGGFLRAGNMTLLIGTSDRSVEKAIDIIKDNCKRRKEVVSTPLPAGFDGAYLSSQVEVDVGGATIFVLDVERHEKL